jgi:hypothetical protein
VVHMHGLRFLASGCMANVSFNRLALIERPESYTSGIFGAFQSNNLQKPPETCSTSSHVLFHHCSHVPVRYTAHLSLTPSTFHTVSSTPTRTPSHGFATILPLPLISHTIFTCTSSFPLDIHLADR